MLRTPVVLSSAMVLGLALAACGDGGAERAATVSGKVVYRGMGLEGVPVLALARDQGRWVPAARTQSGYHGSFRLSVPPGEYALEVDVDGSRVGRPGARLRGRVDGLVVRKADRRMDRVAIGLALRE